MTWLAKIIGLMFLATVSTAAYIKYKQIRSKFDPGEFAISLNCSKWSYPTLNFEDFLTIGPTEEVPNYSFYTVEAGRQTIIGYGINKKVIAVGPIMGYQHGNFGYLLQDEELRIQGLQNPQDSYALVREFQSENSNVAIAIRTIKGFGLIAYSETGTQYVCELKKTRVACKDNHKNPLSFGAVVRITPGLRPALNYLCDPNGPTETELEKEILSLNAACPLGNFKMNRNFRNLCRSIPASY